MTPRRGGSWLPLAVSHTSARPGGPPFHTVDLRDLELRLCRHHDAVLQPGPATRRTPADPVWVCRRHPNHPGIRPGWGDPHGDRDRDGPAVPGAALWRQSMGEHLCGPAAHRLGHLVDDRWTGERLLRVFAAIEIACTLFIVWYAWTWRKPTLSATPATQLRATTPASS